MTRWRSVLAGTNPERLRTLGAALSKLGATVHGPSFDTSEKQQGTAPRSEGTRRAHRRQNLIRLRCSLAAKDLAMRILRNVTTFTLVFSTIAIGCAVSAEDESGESLGSLTQALPRADAAPYDPTDYCRADCTGRRCGESDGCFGRCQGACPAGTVCGGGGTPFVCACPSDCAGKECGAPDGCGGICTTGTCANGEVCGAGGAPGKCAPLAQGQGVECFVFDDGYSKMKGPSDAIYFNNEGQACIPDSTPGGLCRRWFGRCRTTDPSHTPVEFAVGDWSSWYAWADAVFSRHYTVPFSYYENAEMCVPSGPHGLCGAHFGAARTITGRSVHCRLFDDGTKAVTPLSDRMSDHTRERVWAAGVPSNVRKWFGLCEVGGCGDGFCDAGEDVWTCPKDCTCGDSICNGSENTSRCPNDCWCGNGQCDPGETASSCSKDCWCGDGNCDASESRSSCPKDCGGTWCGDGACNGGETCESCAQDCGQCMVTTCSGQKATTEASIHTVFYEDLVACAYAASLIANSRNEAEECVKKAGYNVVSSPTVSDRVFHTDPTNGCSQLSVPSFSDKSAAVCAAAHGYTLPGPCPWPYVESDAGAGDAGNGK